MDPKERELRHKIGELTQQMRAILDGAEKDGREELTVAELRRFENLKKKLDMAEQDLRLRGIESWASRSLTGDDNGASRLFNGPGVAEPRPVPPVAAAGRTIGWTSDGKELRALGRGERFGAQQDEAEARRGLGALVRLAAGCNIGRDEQERAMQVGAGTTGGYLIAEPVSNMLIDIARSKARVVEAGALTMPVGSSSVTIARLAQDPSPRWQRELQDGTLSDAQLEALVLQPKPLVAFVECSLELLQDAPNAESVITNSLTEALALELDRSCLFGEGVTEPLGVESWVAPLGDLHVISSVGALADYSDFVNAHTAIAGSNGTAAAVILAPRDAGTLAGLTDSTNQPLRRPAILDELSWLPTTQVPVNRGAGENESVAVMGDFTQLLIGVREQITIEFSRDASVDGRSAFSRSSVMIRARLRADVVPLRAAHFCVLQGIVPA